MELLLGWAVVMIALIVVCGPVLWLAYKHRPIDTPTIIWPEIITEIPSFVYDTTLPATTQVIEPLLIDIRPAEKHDVVTDLLGEWRPSDYTQSAPLLLGHVLTEGQWETFGTSELAVLSA